MMIFCFKHRKISWQGYTWLEVNSENKVCDEVGIEQ